MYSIRLPTEVSGICGIYGGLCVLDSGSTGLWVSGPRVSLGSFRVLRASGPRSLGVFRLSLVS